MHFIVGEMYMWRTNTAQYECVMSTTIEIGFRLPGTAKVHYYGITDARRDWRQVKGKIKKLKTKITYWK